MPTTSNFGWTTPADTDLVKDGAAAIRTLGNGIDTSLIDLKGGTTGQVLAKASNTDLDFNWVAQDDSNAIQNAIVDAKGDLISATAADTPARLAVGTNGEVLTADSTTATGLKWAAPSSGLTLSQIATGTLTGSSVTVSSLSTYDTLIIILEAIDPSAATIASIRLNNNSGANYNGAGAEQVGSTTYDVGFGGATRLNMNYQTNLRASTVDNKFITTLTNCKSAGFTNWDVKGYYKNDTPATVLANHAGIYTVAEAISSIVILLNTGTFDAGTYTIWGG